MSRDIRPYQKILAGAGMDDDREPSEICGACWHSDFYHDEGLGCMVCRMTEAPEKQCKTFVFQPWVRPA